MRRRWRYLLGAFLLAAGMMAGCTGEVVTPQETIQEFQSQETESIEEAESEDLKVETQGETEADSFEAETSEESEIQEEGIYTSKDEVAEYIYLYGHLPDNFITKKEAKALGWVSSEGNLAEAAPGKSIGGDYFGNFEGNLPEKKGREYHECDIDSDGGYRGAKRLVFSNDGLIYYTEDHYETFELLYGEE